jgi:hypothetical protein
MLPEEEAEAVAEHIETCSACETTVQELEREGDFLLQGFRRPALTVAGLNSPEYQQATAAGRSGVLPSRRVRWRTISNSKSGERRDVKQFPSLARRGCPARRRVELVEFMDNPAGNCDGLYEATRIDVTLLTRRCTGGKRESFLA